MRYTLTVSRKEWLTPDTFEIRFERPVGFDFLPGQKIRFIEDTVGRDYTLINAPRDPELALLVRLIPEGAFSPRLANAGVGEVFSVEGPFGYFGFQPSTRPAIWVATGTGIAPFVAFARAGLWGRDLLHGVRRPAELYYRAELEGGVTRYLGCITGPEAPAGCYPGRVTDFLERHLAAGVYDFYLCGRMEMIAAAMGIVDRRFGGSHVFTEAFF